MSKDSSMRGGIDLGGTKIEAIVVDDDNQVRGSAREPTPTDGGPAGVAAQMAKVLQEAAEAAGVGPGDLAGVGVGSPGDVNDEEGTVGNAGNLPDWSGTFELAKSLRDALGCPIHLGNDVQVATRAEAKLGAGADFRSLIMVAWGTGIGGGIILDGQPWIGRGAAGEIGHTVVKAGGAHCQCGRRGCLEAYAGRGSMEARARREVDKEGAQTDLFKIMEHRGRTRLTSSIWAHALERGDHLAHELIDRAVCALGVGIASAINLLDVEAVIIGGGLGVRFGEPMVERIEVAMKPHLFNDFRPPAVRVAGLGDLGGAMGAALLATR
ncbi:MAG TPA: ROK family protein [Solirubrobacteraceae bacterium]|nr:ROK family protein [Solirubrobacteraceae bacterium]